MNLVRGSRKERGQRGTSRKDDGDGWALSSLNSEMGHHPHQPSIRLLSPSPSEWAIVEDSISLVVSDKLFKQGTSGV